MAIKNLDWWYDASQRRYLLQIVRAFSGFQYLPGVRNGVQQPLRMVPCHFANTSRMVGHIMRNLSENTLLSVPMITLFQTGLRGRRADVQYPGLVEGINVSERAISGGKYTGDHGQNYTVERMMPRPFEMTIQVDIWTSNLDQKYQLAEQILTVIYPSFDIQNSENALDWTALTTVYVEDDVIFSSRSIPIGTENEIDIMTIPLRLPIWLSPPAKVKQQTIIQTIIANISDGGVVNGMEVAAGPMERVITSPGDYHIKIDDEYITLTNSNNGDTDENGLPMDWSKVLPLYGTFIPTVSRIILYTSDRLDQGPSISGTLQLDQGAANTLIWTVDPATLPANTLFPIKAVIDPLRTIPGQTAGLSAPVNGDRYMIISDLGPSSAWPGLTASVNDIIQYNNGAWTVAFDASATKTIQYVLNAHTGSQLRWTGSQWINNINGTYGPGYWKLAL